jgi:hypothetical protein
MSPDATRGHFRSAHPINIAARTCWQVNFTASPSTSDMLASLGSLRFENIRHLTQPPDIQGTERSKAPEFNAFCLVGSLNKGVRVASGPP